MYAFPFRYRTVSLGLTPGPINTHRRNNPLPENLPLSTLNQLSPWSLILRPNKVRKHIPKITVPSQTLNPKIQARMKTYPHPRTPSRDPEWRTKTHPPRTGTPVCTPHPTPRTPDLYPQYTPHTPEDLHPHRTQTYPAHDHMDQQYVPDAIIPPKSIILRFTATYVLSHALML